MLIVLMSHILLCISCCKTTNKALLGVNEEKKIIDQHELDLGEICVKAIHR